MADYNTVKLTPIEENFKSIVNWRCHILFTMLRTSHQLSKFPPIVREIFKERQIDSKAFDSNFIGMMELGQVSFTKAEYTRLIQYVSKMFDFDAEKLERCLAIEVLHLPAQEYLKEEKDIEALSLIALGKVMFNYNFM